VRRLSDITHVGRFFDLSLGSNRVAFIAPAIAGLAMLVLDPSDQRRAVSTGLATFAAWAIARELDPDRPRSAAFAAVLTPFIALAIGPPAAAPLFVAMLVLRVVTRSTGLAPKVTDMAALTLGAILVADTAWGWAAGIVFAFAMVRDAALPGDPPRNAGVWGLLLAAGSTVRVSIAGVLGEWTSPDPTTTVVLVLGLAGAVILVEPRPILAMTDWTRQALDPQRLREATMFGLAVGVLGFAAAGAPGIVALAPLHLSYASAAAFQLIAKSR
jgi:hypothetical protein